MHLALALSLCLSLTTICLVVWEQHLLVLREVTWTYSTFHSYIRDYKEVVYHYSSLSNHANAQPTEQVPRIIHQITLTEGNDAHLLAYQQSSEVCRELHPTWRHMHWTDDNATIFIREQYSSLAPHYEGYRHSIQRANSLRYALLHHFGGVYLDLDITCLQPLDELLHLPFLTPAAHPAGVNNAFILSRPGHGLLRLLLDRLPQYNLRWPTPYVEDMLVAGTMFFSNVWMEYVRCTNRYGEPSEAVRVLADENGKLMPHMLRGKVTTPLFSHGGASTWHSWDASVMLFIGRHYMLCIILASSAILGILVLGLKLSFSRIRRSRRWPLNLPFTSRYVAESRPEDV